MSAITLQPPTGSDARAQLALVQDYLAGDEGIWIDEETWREQARYERDTNAWTYDPYDRVSTAEIVDDAQALLAAVLAVQGRPPETDEIDALVEVRADGETFARQLIASRGRAQSTPDLAEQLHRWWGLLEEAWLEIEHDLATADAE